MRDVSGMHLRTTVFAVCLIVAWVCASSALAGKSSSGDRRGGGKSSNTQQVTDSGSNTPDPTSQSGDSNEAPVRISGRTRFLIEETADARGQILAIESRELGLVFVTHESNTNYGFETGSELTITARPIGSLIYALSTVESVDPPCEGDASRTCRGSSSP